jgi:hypothetical protein
MYQFARNVSMQLQPGRLSIYRRDEPRYVYTDQSCIAALIKLYKMRFDKAQFQNALKSLKEIDAEELFSLLESHAIILDTASTVAQIVELNDLSAGESTMNREYIDRTTNYPFFDYASDGIAKDAARMEVYYAEAKNEDRYRNYDFLTPLEEIPTDAANHPEQIFDFLDSSNLDTSNKLGSVALTKLCINACLGTSFTRKTENHYSIRKYVPSGGGRHPTLSILIDLSNGTVLEFDDKGNQFKHIAQCGPEKVLELFGDNHSYLGFRPSCVVLLLCEWEKNMFRYREGRTYRSVHMDAGHALNAIEQVLALLGTRTHAQYNINSILVQSITGRNEFEAGIMGALFVK